MPTVTPAQIWTRAHIPELDAGAVVGDVAVSQGALVAVGSNGDSAAAWYSAHGGEWQPANVEHAAGAVMDRIGLGYESLLAAGYRHTARGRRPALWQRDDAGTWRWIDLGTPQVVEGPIQLAAGATPEMTVLVVRDCVLETGGYPTRCDARALMNATGEWTESTLRAPSSDLPFTQLGDFVARGRGVIVGLACSESSGATRCFDVAWRATAHGWAVLASAATDDDSSWGFDVALGPGGVIETLAQQSGTLHQLVGDSWKTITPTFDVPLADPPRLARLVGGGEAWYAAAYGSEGPIVLRSVDGIKWVSQSAVCCFDGGDLNLEHFALWGDYAVIAGGNDTSQKSEVWWAYLGGQ